MHGIYQFDEAVHAISVLKTPLRTGFLPVSLVHARTKLVDVYEVLPVNAEEEGLPIGPYCYTSFPPLNQDMQRVAVVNELSASDVPDISQLVTVDVESISGSARRDSRDSESDSEQQQSIGVVRVDGAFAISGSVSSDNDDGSEPSHPSGAHVDPSGSTFVSIESIITPIIDTETDMTCPAHFGEDSEDEEVVPDAETAEEVVPDAETAEEEEPHDPADADSSLSDDIGVETRPGAVVTISDTVDDVSSEDAADAPVQDTAERQDDSDGSHRFFVLFLHTRPFVLNVCRIVILFFLVRSSPHVEKSSFQEDFS